MVRRGRVRDSGLDPREDDRADGHGRERCDVGVRVLEGSDRYGSGHCGYGRDDHGRDESYHHVDGRLHVRDLHENDLSGHVRHASAHARDARGRRRSCQ